MPPKVPAKQGVRDLNVEDFGPDGVLADPAMVAHYAAERQKLIAPPPRRKREKSAKAVEVESAPAYANVDGTMGEEPGPVAGEDAAPVSTEGAPEVESGSAETAHETVTLPDGSEVCANC